MKTMTKTLFTAATLTLASAASAGDTVNLEEHEAKGYFDKVGRVGAFVGIVSGTEPRTEPLSGGSVGPTGAVLPTTRDYKRTGFGVDFDLLGFWDATRFDTLLGAELLMKLGGYTSPKSDTTTETEADKTNILFRMDAAADYGLIHWGGAIKGRISGGAGFGFDIDGGRWWAPGRAYPLLLARVQLGTDSLALHGSYHYVPTTTNEAFVREHRFEAAAGIGALHAGVRLVLTPARRSENDPWSTARELGAFVAFAF